jgi:hypothetical protein
MKTLIALFVLLFAFSSQALTRSQLEALLKEKGINLMEVEMQGMRVLMGEVSGHINAVPFAKVQILVTEQEAILKREIDSVDFSGAQNMGAVSSVRYNGQYVMKKDIKATIVSQ